MVLFHVTSSLWKGTRREAKSKKKNCYNSVLSIFENSKLRKHFLSFLSSTRFYHCPNFLSLRVSLFSSFPAQYTAKNLFPAFVIPRPIDNRFNIIPFRSNLSNLQSWIIYPLAGCCFSFVQLYSTSCILLESKNNRFRGTNRFLFTVLQFHPTLRVTFPYGNKLSKQRHG